MESIKSLASSNKGILQLRKRHFDLDKNILISDNGSPIKGFTTVMFYAEFCGHCHHTFPELLKGFESGKCYAKSKNDATVSTCHVAICERSKETKDKLDIEDDSKVDDETFDEKMGIEGFPTIKQFLNGVFYRDFEGERTALKFKLFMTGVKNYESPNIVTLSKTKSPPKRKLKKRSRKSRSRSR